MKNIFFAVCTLLLVSFLTTASTAQNGKKIKDAVITYNMGVDSDNPAAAMMGSTTMKIGFKGDLSSADINMMNGMMTTNTLFDNKEKKGLILMNVPMMNKKIGVKMNEEELKEFQKKQYKNASPPKIEYFKGQTKKIAGYKCYKAIATMSGVDDPVVMYICENIQPAGTSQWQMQYPNLKGYPLSIEVKQQGMKITFTAKEVDAKAAKDLKFSMEIPEGYEEMTLKEFEEMSKGGGAFGM
ncbi:hypothetical protein [Aureispira anguillae]|uniref:DUF4412 domain-containing protein n=1 Tax=Aureispira anguillae TaxID=2864201 RepID=A0A915YG89_9BACT|nr:hypothetical protein [Aureispira anguillae]BDS12465.1 hypothetical protein AsAng_0031880 [Aureispira anguillae]